METVVGLFRSGGEARSAMARLDELGYRTERVGWVSARDGDGADGRVGVLADPASPAVAAIWGAPPGVDDGPSRRYREGVASGGVLLTVDVPDGLGLPVAVDLSDMGAAAVDIHRESGWMDGL